MSEAPSLCFGRNVAPLAGYTVPRGYDPPGERCWMDMEEMFGVIGRDEHFDALIGLEFGDVDADRVTGWLDVAERHHQPNGIVHGGVYASVVETLASTGAAVWAYQNLDGQIAVGLSNATDFLRAHRQGRIDAVAEPIHRGRTQQLWQVTLTRASDGKMVARGQVRLQNVTLEDVASRGT